MLKIRLKRVGRKRLNFFRIVVVSEKQKRDTGKLVDDLGYYQPSSKDTYLKMDTDLYNKHKTNGAQPTDRIKKLYNIASQYASKDVIAGKA